MTKYRDWEDALWSNISLGPSGCWEWVGYIATTGYGMAHFDRKRRLAHRLSWELHNGAIPPGILLCHSCDVRHCVNPDHMFLGSHTDNNRDMAEKLRNWQQKKTHCPKGHPYSGENLAYKMTRGKVVGRICLICRNDRNASRY